jgi:hypothetical protein
MEAIYQKTWNHSLDAFRKGAFKSIVGEPVAVALACTWATRMLGTLGYHLDSYRLREKYEYDEMKIDIMIPAWFVA